MTSPQTPPLLTLLVVLSSAIALADDADLTFITNGRLKLGIKSSSGGGIAWISQADSDRNVVNHFDRGRLIQQSYYGRPDGSLWNKQPWRWNPVQGGDWQGKPAKLLELRAEEDSLFARTLPKHWASGADLDETRMEQQIDFEDELIHVRYRFTYTGSLSHPEHDQEIPAFFVEPDLDTLVVYQGDAPWTGASADRSVPGWPNEPRKMTEHWAAYVDKNDFGIGAYVPAADSLTCYRFGNGNARKGACSYFAPLTRFSIKPGFEWKYDLYITVGTAGQIRERFTTLHAKQKP